MPSLRISNIDKGKAEGRNKESAGKIAIELFILGKLFGSFPPSGNYTQFGLFSASNVRN